jgi:hypothetical protein
MKSQSSIGIARALINRYGLHAQAIAEERAAIMAHEDPGTRYFWEQVPSAVCELRRSASALDRQRGRLSEK